MRIESKYFHKEFGFACNTFGASWRGKFPHFGCLIVVPAWFQQGGIGLENFLQLIDGLVNIVLFEGRVDRIFELYAGAVTTFHGIFECEGWKSQDEEDSNFDHKLSLNIKNYKKPKSYILSNFIDTKVDKVGFG